MAGIREVYRAGWLKKITSDDKKKTFKNPRVEKVWLVFCVHDGRLPFLEQYGSRQLAAGHQPQFAYPLAECYHVSASIRPTLDGETEFVITLRQDVVKFSSSRREVINDWISTLRNQLHELHVLEAKSNLYTKAPRPAASPAPFGLQRDPNSPLPAPPPQDAAANTANRGETPAARNATQSPTLADGASGEAAAATASSASCEGPQPRRTAPTVPVTVRPAGDTPPPAAAPPHWQSFDDPSEPIAGVLATDPALSNGQTAAAANGDESRHVTVISVGQALTLTVPDSAAGADTAPTSGSAASIAQHPPASRATSTAASTLSVAARQGVSAALPLATPAPAVRAGLATLPAAAPRHAPLARDPATGDRRPAAASVRLPAAAAAAAVRGQQSGSGSVYERLSEASSPTVAAGARPVFPADTLSRLATVRRSHSSAVPQQHRPAPRPALQRQTSDTSLDSRGAAAAGSRAAADPGDRGTLPPQHRQEAGAQLSLREHQVRVLRREIAHRAGVRVLLPRRTVSSALALADAYGALWLCGWKWREQPALSCALHVGDRVVSVGGVAVSSAAEFSRVVKQHAPPVMELVVQRMPHAMVIAMKRETEGQPLGLVRHGGSGEILQVLPDGLAAAHGLPARSGAAESPPPAPLCNWYITEVNSRAVSLFSKDSQLTERLAAVGRDISLVVQPADLVHALKRHLKTLRGYKQYVVQ